MGYCLILLYVRNEDPEDSCYTKYSEYDSASYRTSLRLEYELEAAFGLEATDRGVKLMLVATRLYVSNISSEDQG